MIAALVKSIIIELKEGFKLRSSVRSRLCFLQSFLASKEGEQRLAQLKERFEQGGQAKLPAEAQALLSTWHQEQEGELATLRAHCQGRHKQLDDILHNLNRYMEEVLIMAISCYSCFDSFMTLSLVCMRNITI